MNQSEESKSSEINNFTDNDIKKAVQEIYDANKSNTITNDDLSRNLKIKLRIGLGEHLPNDIKVSAEKYLEEIQSTKDISREEISQEINEYEKKKGIIITLAKSYNDVISNEKTELSKAFRIAVDRKKEVPDEILNDIFSSLYSFYNGRKILEDEIRDIKKLSIANIIKPSKFKSALRTIFCCGRKSKYARQQEIFMSNVKEILKLAMNATDKSNDISILSEIPQRN